MYISMQKKPSAYPTLIIISLEDLSTVRANKYVISLSIFEKHKNNLL